MKILILSTDTLHHAWYISQIKKSYDDLEVILETKSLKPPFEIHHSFEDRREEYESIYFFQGRTPNISELTKTQLVKTINSDECLELITQLSPDVVITFGTCKLKSFIIDACPNILNLHGGDPEAYRGLDSHLWGIYHSDAKRLATCLHVLVENLDEGEIVGLEHLDISGLDELHQLRALNTEACVRLSLSALSHFEKHKSFPLRKQTKVGRYYSFMPSCLKDICVKRFPKLIK